VEVDEPELNGRIAVIAAQSGKRPEKVKQEMSADGSLMNMYVQMREQKAIDKILELAVVEDVDLPPEKPSGDSTAAAIQTGDSTDV
jgi:anaerobic ribonucleoside-triphosphate reductase